MKKLLFIALFIIPFCGFSQTKQIDGFLGIKFGSSREEVIAGVKAKGGTLTAEDKAHGILQFSNVSLGQRAAEYLNVSFVNDKAYHAVFFFSPEKDAQAIDYYTALVSDISEIYGKAKSHKVFKSPFTDGDGNELEAIEGGYADYYTNWTSNKKIIQASINTKMKVLLAYQDDVLSDEAEKQQKAKDKGDF